MIGDKQMRAVNPANGEVVNTYAEHDPKQLAEILEKTQEAWLQWRGTEISIRKELLLKVAQLLRSQQEQYARLITLEMGKIISEARAEVEKCAWVCEYYAENAETFLKDEIVKTNASKSFISYEPLGIILAIMPWNFPFWQVFRFAAPALMAGNASLLKHASNVPGSALAIESIFREAGFPQDLFRTLLLPASQIESLTLDKRIKAVTLTGSEAAGKAVAATAGRALKKTVLELGGSDPYIILEDADMSASIRNAVTSRMINNGQSCIAAKRFIVVESRISEFENQFGSLMNNLQMGNPLEEDTQVGPLARLDLREELHDQVLRTLNKGARLITGGEIVAGAGAFYTPTVVGDVKKGMALYHEEIFGPVAAVIQVKDANEAISVANDSDFGLGASIWTKDITIGEALAREIESGAVFVNGMTVSDPRLPFGGVKGSGYGRELSHFGIREFVNIKSIWIA
jgi:succinate-semialdehyde dehydrogenase/glutarate-semialdehyde dehydrogenase